MLACGSMVKSASEIQELKDERDILKRYEHLRNPIALIRLKEVRKKLNNAWRMNNGKQPTT